MKRLVEADADAGEDDDAPPQQRRRSLFTELQLAPPEQDPGEQLDRSAWQQVASHNKLPTCIAV